MIVTLTLNPSLDRTAEIGKLVRGNVIRASSARLDPGGKGVNVTRALLANGTPSRAVLPCGGETGGHLTRLLRSERVDVVAVPIGAATRSNIALAEPDGTITKINEPGASLTAGELDAVARAVHAAAGSIGWVAICGSLPPGAPVGFYAELCQSCGERGIQVAVDTSGPALLAAIKARPALVKPNREELAAAVGGPVMTLGDVVEAAQELRAWGAGSVLASLGPDGAVLVTEDSVICGRAEVGRPRSSVGAGDAMLAGYLAGGARGAGAFARALAWSAAAVGLPGSRMPGPDDIRHDVVSVRAGLDPALELTPPINPRRSTTI